jgi:hypothetical protein
MTVSNSFLEQGLSLGTVPTAEDIVQAVVRVVPQKCTCLALILRVVQAYSSGGVARQIVTGVAERGEESVIRYWIQESGLQKRAEPKSQVVAEQVWGYLAAHVR